ncbi:MAG: hypothetical protein F4Z02_12585 [Acidimicrobiia bacterium]|nr:hypothetical protein [Acidimicrobiia bacterium]MYG72756.1 hypothetical protein [Acidimicrobiia bacterium]
MTRRVGDTPADIERALFGWPRCPSKVHIESEGEQRRACGALSSRLGIELFEMMGNKRSPPCSEHLSGLYEAALTAASYGEDDPRQWQAEWSGPRHLGWERIIGETGKRALRRLAERAHSGDLEATQWLACLLVVRREYRKGRLK